MTTANKLWIGFGTLTALLVAVSLAISVSVWSVDGRVRDMADARNLSAASAQLETDTLSYALNVRSYLQTGDAQVLKQLAESAAAVDRDLSTYLHLEPSDHRHELAARFQPLWQELRTMGEALVDPESRALRLDHSRRFLELRERVQQMLAGEMQVDALAVYNQRKDELLQDVRNITRSALFLMVAGTLIALATSVTVARGVIADERRLWSHRETLRVTLASIGDAVITTDTRGYVTYLNAAAEAMCGWRDAEAVGKSLETVVHIVDEDTRQRVQNPAERVLREGAVIGLASRAVLLARDGRERPIDDSAAPIRDESGRIAGVVLVFRDNTERRRLERELRRNAADLADADRRKNEFLAMLAHELRNPLAPVGNGLQLLHLRSAEAPGLQPVLTMMERQVAQMVRLVDDLLDVSRISRGKIELRQQPTPLVPALQLAVDAVRPLLDSLGHALSLQLPQQPVVVDADPARLAQIVGNLLNNAAKFTDRGGRVALEVQIEGDWVAIRVRDNGIGITAQQLPYVFDLYMQAETSMGRAESGVGIGLALVKSLVDLHGGTVSVSSAGLGRGSEFVVRLPLHRAVSPPPGVGQGSGVPAAAVSAASGLRVMVVDDNHDAAASMALLMEMSGHEVRIASDGMEALDMAESWRPQAILLDIGLPRLNGFEVARALRAQEWGRSVLLIALTGWGQDRDRQQSSDTGFDAHLVKPADPVVLRRLLAQGRTAGTQAVADDGLEI